MPRAKPACWRWKPPSDIGAVLLHEKMRRDCFERGGEAGLRKYGHRFEYRAQHRLLWEWHKGRCAICGRSQNRNTDLVTDHDHETDLVRGFLCRSCNTLEGNRGLADGETISMYRERPSAVICGVRLIYADPWGRSGIVIRRTEVIVQPSCAGE